MGIFSKDPLQIIVFLSYGTKHHLYVRGRALEDENIKLKSDNFFRQLSNSWKRFESDEIKNCKLKVILPSAEEIITSTDNHGYFLIDEKVTDLHKYADEEGFLKFKVSYFNHQTKSKINNDNIFFGELLIPRKEAEYGIISDIDDTILHTGVTSKLKWKLLVNTFLRSPEKRKALEGASDFYNLLHIGLNAKKANPFFYVSNSPWNMYRYLEYFLNENNFPKGPILLRTMKSVFFKPKNELPKKHQEIIQILETYNNLTFILIGDAGEYDADIYIDVVQNFPNRIKAIFVRAVKHKKKMLRIENIASNFKEIPFYIVNSNEEAIAFAKENKLIKD